MSVFENLNGLKESYPESNFPRFSVSDGLIWLRSAKPCKEMQTAV